MTRKTLELAERSNMRQLFKTVLAGCLAGGLMTGAAMAAADGKSEAVKPTSKDHPLEEIWSGYHFSKKGTKETQDNDFDNPGNLWLEQGEELWSKVDGEEKKSCQSCHNDAAKSMKGVATRYPVYFPPWKKLINLEQRINLCREKQMKAKAYKWKSNELLGITIYVARQSLGMPQAVVLDDKTKPFWEKGKAHYYKRRGQLDMACAHCHEANYGKKIRSNTLTQGQANGFPTYRLKWGKPGSIQRRFKGCNKQVRAKPYKMGSDEYVNLEHYVRWRGQGLPIETPSVRP